MAYEEIKAKIEKFFDKLKLVKEDRYVICKRLEEDYWEEITTEGYEDDEEDDDDILSDLEEPDDEEELPAPAPRHGVVRRPQLSVKKGDKDGTKKSDKK